jgi:signal transduction histidine kinase
MISNLLLNACEAIASLGKITVETGYSDDGSIEISIADTGKGIAEEDLPKIFDSFFTTKQAGTGLGLSIVESIAKAYGGTVAVKSQVGVGSRFTVRLPTRTVRERQ